MPDKVKPLQKCSGFFFRAITPIKPRNLKINIYFSLKAIASSKRVRTFEYIKTVKQLIMKVEQRLIVELQEVDLYDIFLECYNIENLSLNHFKISEDVKNTAWFISFESSLGRKVLKNKGGISTYYLNK